ncbi:arginine/lysine/ornithine decarboxylase [Lachnospiraceae bacterium JC7]|nr:arginine/lysine/ornithine decarboxylase [Lachnospiraceae bacterium JC7]
MKRKQSLFESLKLYIEKGIYPLHMPGHKRRMNTPGLPTLYDFTEVEGTDDLHHAEGILRDSMERTAGLFGADRSWYLVNGSTSGNLIGISAICPLNGELIVARNCHRSVFHALELRNIRAHFVYPDFEKDFGIFGGVSPEAVEELFRKYPESRGVVITSPTYEGVVSDIAGIASVCHRHSAVLFVDEAHGAHFGLVGSAGFPESAVKCGADLSVQSAHKTLIGLTQTAFLHMKSSLIDTDKIGRFIDIYETSSPSYPMMISLDACTEMVMNEGEKVFGNWAETLRLFDEKIGSLRHFRVLCHGGDAPEDHGFFDFDKSKLLVNCRNTHLNGERFMEIMRDRFGFELEMQLSDNALAMTGPGDDRQQILRFAEALLTLDREEEYGDTFCDRSEDVPRMPEAHEHELKKECAVRRDPGEIYGSGTDYMSLMSTELCQAVTIQCAVESESEEVDISKASDRISSEYVYCYPPGVPVVVPGETLDENCVEGLLKLFKNGYKLHFTKSSPYQKVISCIKVDKK